MTPHNAQRFFKYIGIPYSAYGKRPGLNCWELVEKVMIDEFGIVPPHYEYDDDYRKVDSLFVSELQRWQHIEYDDRRPGDLILLIVQGVPIHLGILIDQNLMLHTLPGIESVCEDFTRQPWKNRISGIYRWIATNKSSSAMAG